MREVVAALKHDLAKYVAWRSVNFPDAEWNGPLREGLQQALQADILATHGDEAAWDVWQRHAASLPRPLSEPELVAVEQAVQSLRRHESALRDGDGEAIALARSEIRAAQGVIREQLRDLHRRLSRG